MSSATTDPSAIPSPATLHGPSLPLPSLDDFFESDKLTAVAKAKARKSMNIADYPNPDLCIEVDITPPRIDRAGIYAALRVPEVWRFDGETEQVIIERLADDGTYPAVDESGFLPIRADEVRRWVVDEDSDDEAAWAERLRAWVAAELAPRITRLTE